MKLENLKTCLENLYLVEKDGHCACWCRGETQLSIIQKAKCGKSIKLSIRAAFEKYDFIQLSAYQKG